MDFNLNEQEKMLQKLAADFAAREVAPPFHISSADCIECATCVLVCPTGAITLLDITDRRRTLHTWSSQYARQACRLCEYHAEQWLEAEAGG